MGWWPGQLAYLAVVLCYIVAQFELGNAELTPPYFNLATGRKIYASATCGVGTEGPELYCKLVGANTENDHVTSVIQGQVCDYCDPTVPDKNHAAEYAIDGTEAWWMSPPLSRGMKYNEVNLTIDFGQEFHVAYLFIRMGNSPRPGLWTLEKSGDYGKTWTPWQHFSDTPADCETYFGKNTYKPITRDDDVICTTEYSKIVPLENGEIPVMLLNNRPSSTNYFNSSVLQEWTRATNVRIRLLRTKNLLGHLMSMSRQDPTVTRRYFYSIKDISIGGRCMCNGHADTCDVKDPKSPVRILACRCQHHTCGIQCNECCPGFQQKRWRQNTNARPFECEPCNCHGHTNECEYDEEIDNKGLSLDIHGYYAGGGVCKNCQHNTEGINCNKCKGRYYRPAGKHWNETDVCKPCDCNYSNSTGHCEELTGRCECKKAFQPPNCDSCAYGYYGYPNCKECECNLNGTYGYHCEAENGNCPCKINFAGSYCKQCAVGYYGFPECKACECNRIGSTGVDCDLTTGKCQCENKFGGDRCDRCRHGFFNYPECQYCDCDNQGTEEEVCAKDTGKCICREGFGGPRCDQCLPGYYNYPECKPCNCSNTGSTAPTCDNTGKCACLPNFAGKKCTLCSAGFYSYPECLPCNCDGHGSEGVTCNSDGQCLCLSNFDGKLCDTCKKGFYNFPSCEDCNCDPAGVIYKFAGCGSVPVGELCECKERVRGRICNECKPLYWNLNISNPDGCEICDCWTDGTIASLDTCESRTGQCTCKPLVSGRTCRECSPGTYDLDGASLFGCKPCNCDVGGTQEAGCDKVSGQCKCHPRITGRGCTQPLTTHFFPTLHQFQYEFEDGTQLSGALVRYQYNEDVFPGFSGRGYAVFNDIQNEIRNELTVFKSEVYRIIIRYVNTSPNNVTATILIQSENPLEVDQNVKVLLRPTTEPQFVTVSGLKGDKPSAIVLDPGKYTITTKTNNNIMLDYFVLLPSAYYEASILTRKILTPCELGNMELCRHYKYPSLEEYHPNAFPFVTDASNNQVQPKNSYNDLEHLNIINHDGEIPVLSNEQPYLKYNIEIPHSGRYIFVIDYVSEVNYAESYYIKFSLNGNEDDYGSAQIYQCLYSMACRTPIIDDNSREKVFYIPKDNKLPFVISKHDETSFDHIPIISVTAIPVEEYSVDFINPSPVCVIHNKVCVKRKFRTVPDSKKIEFETDHDDRISQQKPAYAVLDERVKLVLLSSREEGSIVIESKLPERKRYVIVLKYYQPDHAKFHLLYSLSSGKNQYDGKFSVKHCPASSGCLGVIHPNVDDWWFDLDEDFKLTLTNNQPQMLWLDYILIVPVNQYNDDLLVEETFDQTEEFIKNCGQEHFHITHNASDFCKQAVFSLTAGYNGGALPCSCNDKGSTSFECHPFGGQCQCKPNVIGRQCDACRTGYYGFPDCKPCDCPITAMCEPNTGECVCPTNVMGELCDKCMPNTYGFHQIIGCEDCNCSPYGIINGRTQCNMFNGTCDCRPNIEGRACDKCSNGFFDYPRCEQCTCDVAGTEFEVCDKVDGRCICKKNVIGHDCDQCVPGTYNLQASNPDGCTTCFCFGKTSRCESTYLRVYNVSLLNKISLIDVQFNGDNTGNFELSFLDISVDDLMVNETTLEVDFSQVEKGIVDDKDNVIYFGTIDYLLNQNSHISAYGGELGYSLYYTTGPKGKPLNFPDVILLSRNNILVHYSYEQPASNQLFRNRIEMIETNFQMKDGKPVSRADFMMTLRELDTVLVRANYWEDTIVTQLSDVYLMLADDEEQSFAQNLVDHGDHKLLAVEYCQCPPGYEGLSCQDCAPGYYRDLTGPYGGYCIKCDCNGHSDNCDCATGICKDCQHSTTGDHCEKCVEGYHGNATHGTPHDCMICACPLPFDTNNFATGCEISESGNEIHCECKPGYTGARCESCANGFYGDPEKPHDYCKPCQCSGNINVEESGSCDTRTGECLLCLNNTFGTACNLCAPGFYGDAVTLKNCRSCDCEELGTLSCDPEVGACKCHENVIGQRCDRCKPDHYGYDSGWGCRACDCGIASNSTQCDHHTGNCACKPGVTGRQCDRCAPDHWNYTANGCTPCRCNQGYSRGFGCNALTGQCECLPNVIGDRCDACPHRSVLIKDSGCAECDACHHALLDVTDDLRTQIDPVMIEFETVAFAFFTSQKLNHYDMQADELIPQVSALDSKSVNLKPLQKEVDGLEAEIKTHGKHGFFVSLRSLDTLRTADALLTNATILNNETRQRAAEARNAIVAVESLSRNLEDTAATFLEAKLENAQNILNKINEEKFDFSAHDELLNRAMHLLDEVDVIVQPIKHENQSFEAVKNDFGKFSDKLEDLYKWGEKALNKAAEAEDLNMQNKKAYENSQFALASEHQKEMDIHAYDPSSFVINGYLTLNAIDKNLDQLNNALKNLKTINKNIEDNLPEMESEEFKASKLTDKAELYAANLTAQASHLTEHYAHMTANAEPAIKAATAYSGIVEAVSSGKQFAKEAKQLAGNATQITEGVGERASRADFDSGELLQKAHAALQKVHDELEQRQEQATAKVKDISDMNENSDKRLKDINIALKALPTDTLRDTWNNSNENAVDALGVTEAVLKKFEPVVKHIPGELGKARNISKDIDVTNKAIVQIKNNIDSITTSLPELKQLDENIANEQNKVEDIRQKLSDDMESLKHRIAAARQIANGIKVGAHFTPSTVLELKPPETLPLLATKSKISAYFKTKSPNGFLIYLGNDNKTSPQKSNDFMLLKIVNGFPILTYDLGNGIESLTNEKYVADDQWYQAVVERSGPKIKLTIREELDNGQVKEHKEEAELTGQNNVFNLDRNSRLFVGGFASPNDFAAPEEIPSFEGEIEDLYIGDEPVGLFNFVYAEEYGQGALARDKLKTNDKTPTGYRFNGNGFIAMNASPYNFRTRSSVMFKFKADKDSKDGLLFYYGRDNHFMSIELKNGAVYYRFKLGEHMVSSGTKLNEFNNNEWHHVVAERDGRSGLLKVDDMLIFQENAPVSADENMPPFPVMYFGGAPGRRNHSAIVAQNFEGCIDDVFISSTKVDLGLNENAVGVKPGCPPKFTTSLAFPPHEYGFLRAANIHTENDFHMQFRFRTRQADGILFYATNYDRSASIGLTINDGSLTLSSMGDEVHTDRKRLDDGEEYIVTVRHSGEELSLAVDGVDEKRFLGSPKPLFIHAGDIYFGGLPNGNTPSRDALATTAYFCGCISDVTIHGEIINFAESIEKRNGATYSNGCPADLLDYDPRLVPIFFPDGSNIDQEEDSGREPNVPLAPLSNLPTTQRTTTTTTTTTTSTTTTTTTQKPFISAEETTQRMSQPTMLDNDIEYTDLALKPENKPEDPRCALPTNPNFDVDVIEAGYRFTGMREQRLEIPTRLREQYDVTLSIRTDFPAGLLFYASYGESDDFISAFLHRGFVYHTMNVGAVFANISSPIKVNNNKWHTVQFLRNSRKVSLFVDGIEADPIDATDTNLMVVDFPIYVGGVHKGLEQQMVLQTDMAKLTNGTFSYFNGCLKDIKFNSLSLERQPDMINVVPCSEQVEKGVFFSKPTGYIKLYDRFVVGTDFTIQCDIRPREPNGLLFSVHGKTSYTIFELADNVLWFTVKSDSKNIVAINYTLPDSGSFCDGKWRTVRAVKSKYVITIVVDNVSMSPNWGSAGSTMTKTNRPLFMGGHQAFHKAPGFKTKKTYKGCMRNVQVNSKNVHITSNLVFGEIWHGVCPLN